MLKTGWQILKATFWEWWNDDIFLLASSVAFYTVFSIAPILVISVGLASLVFSEQMAKEQIAQQIVMLTGGEGGQAVRHVLENAGQMRGNPFAVLGGLILMWIGSTMVFANLQSALNRIWGVKAAPGRSAWKGFILTRIRSFGIVLSVGFLLLVSTAVNALISGLQELVAGPPEQIFWVWRLANAAVSFGVVTLLFAMIYKYLPDVRIVWDDVMIGASITAALFTAGKYLIGLYLGQVAIGSTYGAAGSFVVFLIWIYYSALICFYGAEFTKVYARRLGSGMRTQPHAVRREEGLSGTDTPQSGNFL